MPAPPAMVRRDVDAMYGDVYNHLVPDEVQRVTTPHQWSSASSYIQWYFRVSHPCVTPMFMEIHVGSFHQEILKEKQVKADHVVYMLDVCRRIKVIVRVSA